MRRARSHTADEGDEICDSDDYRDHPRLAFHREVLIGDHWHVIRESFRVAYEDIFQFGNVASASGKTYKGTIAEPQKFWRHCREALAKWVLSQTARYRPTAPPAKRNGMDVDFDAIASVHFLPSAEMLCSQHFYLHAVDILNEGEAREGTERHAHDVAEKRSIVSEKPPGVLPSFDEQLLRDLTFKSTDDVRGSTIFAQDVRAFLSDFCLARRCATACKDIDAAVRRACRCRESGAPQVKGRHEHQSSPSLLRPAIRRIRESEKVTAAQKRIQGELVEVGVEWPDKGFQSEASLCCSIPSLSQTRNNVRPVLLPAGSWDKLRASYRVFGLPRDAKRYSSVPPDVAFELRAATVALRYEHCLASGSLQLCADSTLKVLLSQRGYNVMDLCASPINAFMADTTTALTGSAGGSAAGGGRHPHQHPLVVPRRFCSAFWDTDACFGSMGSALQFDPMRTYAAFRVADESLLFESGGACGAGRDGDAVAAAVAMPGHPDPLSAPLLLTLDVPYDEDLCELLFLKLARECRSYLRSERENEEATGASTVALPLQLPPWVEFVLVLPLWWDIRFSPRHCPKRFFSGAGAPEATSDDRMWALIAKQSAYLHCGHEIEYRWLTELPLAVVRKSDGDTQGEESASDSFSSLAVFDGVFISDSYTYFCTATNQQLSGVTATEVIAISWKPPSTASPTRESLAQLLDQFYGGHRRGEA